MKLVIGTYNVRGIFARSARTKLKALIQSTKPSLDILTIQEHKLRDTSIDFFSSSIWPNAVLFNLPASDGVHAQRNQHVNGGKGGVIIVVSPSIAQLITGHGTLPNNGGLWLHIDTVEGRRLGFAAIYVPNAAADRAILWESLESSLNTSRSWFAAGDFNMITHTMDQAGGSPRTISGDESLRWNTLIQTLDLRDAFKRRADTINFTWDNRRHVLLSAQQNDQGTSPNDGGRILKRLDRIYVDSSLLQHHKSTLITPVSELSDHLMVIAVFQLGPPQGFKKSQYRINTAALQDSRLKEQLQKMWPQWQKKYDDCNTHPISTLKYCIKRAAKFCQLWGKKEAERKKEKRNKLLLIIQGLTLQLQADPANIYTQLKLEAARTDFNAWETQKARWMQSHIDRRWEEEGGRTTKLFFNMIKARKSQTAVHALQDDEGLLHSDQEEMLDLIVKYFSDILQEPAADPMQHLAMEEILDRTKARVTHLEKDSLQKPFSAEELHTAAKLLGKNKSRGPDGVPLDFFLILWDTIAPLLLRATVEGFQQGLILPFFNKGVITLLPKDGDPTLLKNKRPITLLNAVYKIWAKCLQLRLTPVLQRLITWEQNAFLPGRNLHTTVLLCNEAVAEARRNQVDCVLLKIDFRKSFDTLRWEFLYKAMRKMEFGEIFIAFIETLNRNASSLIRLNNSYSDTFEISRSVRQGCPLSPLLFTIAIQVLSDNINSMVENNSISGIHLQSIQMQYSHGCFADDAHLLLQADRSNLLSAKQLLHSYGMASGLMVQWGKSTARWISPDQPPNWLHELDWAWADADETERFLGFQFATTLDHDSIYEGVRQKVLKVINSNSARSTSIHGRVVIANHLMFGIIWFILPLWAGDRNKMRNIEALILRYIWGGNEVSKARHRVAEKILHLRRKDGGLGLMSLQAQAQAFTAKLIRWAYIPGDHPLKSWLIAQFDAIANLRWGCSHITWVTSPSKGQWPPLSPILLHICQTWQSTSKLLGPLHQLPILPWKNLSLWGPKTEGVRNISRSAKTESFTRLKHAGISDIGNITHDGVNAIPIQLATDSPLHTSQIICRAYGKIIDSTPKYSAAYRGLRGFTVLDKKLLPTNLRDIPSELSWSRAAVATYCTSQNRPPDKFLLDWGEKQSILASLQWKDQTEFLAALNASIRRLLSSDTSKIQLRLAKWASSHNFTLKDPSTWTRLWMKNRPIKYSTLQWYILFRAIPTNSWRDPGANRDQEETWCVCCPDRQAEDIQHLFWNCRTVTPIWRWAVDIMHIGFPDSRRWEPSFKQAVLGEKPPDSCKTVSKWWEKWRLAILWIIWSQRNDKIFRNLQPSLSKAKAVAWYRLLLQSRRDWKRHCLSASSQDLTLARRYELDRRHSRKLGLDLFRFRISGDQLFTTWRPP
ncbi:hypothetical protein R1sor_015377 [Riccia sorocarpa]|uniref:Reverse transcriptase domain-containing protein n=1 Tax=Riccia sorocarpa TaxID=122646 RepID=A0ABD3HCE1_9MARC